MGLLRVDHLVEVHGEEGEHDASEGHHAELEDPLVVPIKELVGQGCQGKEAHAEEQAESEAEGGSKVDLAAELVEETHLKEAVVLHLGQELHDDGKDNHHLQALTEEDDKGWHREVQICRSQPRRRDRDVVTQARRLVHAVAHLDPLYVPVDLRTRHVGKPWMASFVLFIIAAPLANLARGVWHGMGEPERRRQQECAKHGLLGGKASKKKEVRTF
mmetsp:Transcript_130053/g.183451  ORF Transcript_130053/g.183451 Transcript_130053/m.183451 type:complete len:216 (+) Transcript_130053:786-1433(+)